jgi:Rieske Fe-S protein
MHFTFRMNSATRRGVLLGAGLAGLAGAGGAVAGCSTAAVPYDSNMFGGIPHDEEVPTPTAGATAIPVASTADIPVGGGMVFAADNLVVTQPATGEFKAFSAVCTHVGCLLDKVSNGTIDCPCHGSTFSIRDGSVVTGPATRPLTPVSITITSGTITLT